MAEGKDTKTNVYDKHKDSKTKNTEADVKLSWKARIGIFLVFPLLVGCIGLYAGYLESTNKPDRELNFDTDFIMPFLLALTLVIVVGFQTKGYTKNQVEPLVKWPKVVRRKKVVHQTLQEGGEGELVNKDETAKKDD